MCRVFLCLLKNRRVPCILCSSATKEAIVVNASNNPSLQKRMLFKGQLKEINAMV